MKTIDVKYKDEAPTKEKVPTEEAKKQPLQLSYFGFTISLSIVILIASTGLFYYNHSLTESIDKTKAAITEENAYIQKERTNPDIIAYDLVEKNKKQIDAAIVRSQAQNYISEIQKLADKYRIHFQWFSFSKDSITTNVSAESEYAIDKKDPIALVSEFIKDFRTNTSWTGSIFSLSPIENISGDKTLRSFSLEFKLR